SANAVRALERRFVRVLRRDVRDDEGGDEVRADAHDGVAGKQSAVLQQALRGEPVGVGAGAEERGFVAYGAEPCATTSEVVFRSGERSTEGAPALGRWRRSPPEVQR